MLNPPLTPQALRLPSPTDRIEASLRSALTQLRLPLSIFGRRHVGSVLTLFAAAERGARPGAIALQEGRLAEASGVRDLALTRIGGSFWRFHTHVPSRVHFHLDDSLTLLRGQQVALGPLTYEKGAASLDLAGGGSVLTIASDAENYTLHRAFYYQLARQNRPDQLKFVVIDPGDVMSPAFERSAHLLGPRIKDSPETAIGALRMLAREPGQTPLVVMILEIGALLERPAFGQALAGLLAAPHVRVIASTERAAVASHPALGGFATRIVGQTRNTGEARLASGIEGSGCESLTGNGDFLIIPGMRRFQCAFVSEGALRALPRGGKTAR